MCLATLGYRKSYFYPYCHLCSKMLSPQTPRREKLCPWTRVARFSTTKYGRFLSVDPSKSSPSNVSIYNSVHVAIGHPETNSTQAVNTAKILIESNPSLCSASLIQLSTWRCSHLLACCWDWLADGRTDTGPFYRPCSAYCAQSVKKRVQLSNRRCSASLNFLRIYWVH